MSVWRILTLPCEDAASLMSESEDRGLPRLDRLALRAHLFSCRSCRRFRRHLAVMRSVARNREPLPPEARERIRGKLEADRPDE